MRRAVVGACIGAMATLLVTARSGLSVTAIAGASASGGALRAIAGASAPTALRVQGGTAVFRAAARLGDFSGTTTAVGGEVTGATPERARGWVDVGLDSLRTGNGRRDRHMREALETARHPRARFDLDSLRRVSADGAVVLHGRFTVRGVTRSARATGTVATDATGGWQLSASFPVSLSAHGITKGISRLGGLLSVMDTVQVDVSLTLRADGD